MVKAMLSRLTYANVMATIAVFLSLGAGAYAVGIGRNDVKSRHIANGTIKSKDVLNRSLTGFDFREEHLGSKEIREDRLDVSQFAKVASDGGSCDPTNAAFADCSTVTVGAEQVSQILVVATGGQYSVGGAATGSCRVTIDAVPLPGSEIFPGEGTSANTNGLAQNGFAVTQVSRRLRRGTHIVVLQCNQIQGNTRLDTNLSVLLLDAI